LKYDQTNKTFTTKDTPTTYYVGFDYGLGDVVTTDQQKAWEAIVLKLLVKISKNPLDSYGAAIGYRSPNFSILGMTLQSFTPFVGYFRTKVNDKDQSGNPIVRRKSGVRAGISLNIDRAVDWVKKKLRRGEHPGARAGSLLGNSSELRNGFGTHRAAGLCPCGLRI
ncbi:MAG TPA: hypothetical protein VEZ11_13200, partial [Thermoanaerobaculia bacterium]|nr:hypothetical protein [Thermoanaerobaculia bacterium]